MSLKKALSVMTAAVAIGLIGFGGWIATLPPDVVRTPAKPVPQTEKDTMLAALALRTNARPLIAIIGLNDATETTDYLVPTGILRRADVADVIMLATGPGPVRLFPALQVEADATVAAFDTLHPQGADYVVVPAMSRDDDPVVLDWLRAQSSKGAVIIGICAGAKIVAAAGLLDGKRATTHWYYLDEMLRRSPSIRHVADRRMVADGRVFTTTGVSASMPMMLALIEAIGGRARAEKVAQDLGMQAWGLEHSTAAFRLTRAFATTVLRNRLAFWMHETFGIRLRPGMDEAAVALVADGWSRTYRSRAVSVAETGQAIVTANGIRILPDRVSGAGSYDRWLTLPTGQTPAEALDNMLGMIGDAYGRPTRDMVAMQLEYPTAEVAR
ncbi:DJ-1/PfpI family protein [Paracoccus alkanivorans]|uniref:Transcriptional regulator n=1 Tax=Paracoccus alkanivorans TaxID=2116655 RepID=A0A3M0MXG7_9RHOB|nr:DJ-1/PfpI family protein [Paracoccus alkanivorans]RMC36047.1 transcriptional regulator [Paracoccus alkanivorans]